MKVTKKNIYCVDKRYNELKDFIIENDASAVVIDILGKTNINIGKNSISIYKISKDELVQKGVVDSVC